MTLVWSALLSLLLVGFFIQIAKRQGWGKAVRQDGPSSHLAKEGTPTMGGIAFLLAALIVWLLSGTDGRDGVAVMMLIAAAGLLGSYDDLVALRRKRHPNISTIDSSTGLLARYRILFQISLGLAFSVYAVRSGYPLFDIVWLDIPAYTFVITGSINALNFSDGLDGLAAGMSALMLLPFIGFNLALCLIGALFGFLWYNAQPARVFMGGVGSEALGAGIAGLAIISGFTWWLPVIAFIPVLEVLSVIIQVLYFRATGGKRFFRMSPLHHHFELSGWAESQVVTRFWLLTAVAVALTLTLSGVAR